MVWKRNTLRDNCDWEPGEPATPTWVNVVAVIVTSLLAFGVWWVVMR